MTEKEKEEIEKLEKFILNNPDLEKLQGLLSEFNIFETLKIVNSEIRHSNVLAWLFNPDGNHGLGNYFLHQFLKFLISSNKQFITENIDIFDFELFKYSDVEVRREWNRIDLLILIKEYSKQIAVVIENKIFTTEGYNQLKGYRDIVEREFKDFIKIYIYLTPELIETDNLSDTNWVNIDYKSISRIIDYLIKYRKDSINENVLSFINQYNIILKRYIVGNSEIERICKQIYKKNKETLELIFEYKPDNYYEISEKIKTLIKNCPDLELDQSGKRYIKFTTDSFDKKIDKIGNSYLKSKRVLLFEFENCEKKVVLNLYIYPALQDYRNKLYDFFKSNPKLFNNTKRKLGDKWQSVYQKKFLTKENLEKHTIEELIEKIEKKWSDFYDNDLKTINNYIEKGWYNT